MAEKFRAITEENIKSSYQEKEDSRFKVKLKLDEFNQNLERTAVIRYLTLVVDFSAASLKQDLRPNRSIVAKQILKDFIKSFSEQNPLSKLSVIATYREGAKLLSDWIQSPDDHC